MVFDKNIFSGTSDLKNLLKYNKNILTNDRTSFLNESLEPILNDINDYNILKDRKIPENNIQKLKDKYIWNVNTKKMGVGLYNSGGHKLSRNLRVKVL